MGYYGFAPYVPVAERQRKAQREVAKMGKKGFKAQPVKIDGRTIAKSFWGQAWCENLEAYMDYANRLPRGRTYVRNGSVVHLEIKPGEIQALVCGSELYKVKLSITPVTKPKWKALCSECAGGIGSLVELLQGRLSDRVMELITRKQSGLFPAPHEFKMTCSCPDSAGMCKHIAAVCYGVGARLDASPELLFILRSANHEELITQAAAAAELTAKASGASELSEQEMGSVFGIEFDTTNAATGNDELHETIAKSEKPTGHSKSSKKSKLAGKKQPRALTAAPAAPSKHAAGRPAKT